MTRAFFDLGPINVSGQSLLIVGSSALFSFLLFVVFERTLIGFGLPANGVKALRWHFILQIGQLIGHFGR